MLSSRANFLSSLAEGLPPHTSHSLAGLSWRWAQRREMICLGCTASKRRGQVWTQNQHSGKLMLSARTRMAKPRAPHCPHVAFVCPGDLIRAQRSISQKLLPRILASQGVEPGCQGAAWQRISEDSPLFTPAGPQPCWEGEAEARTWRGLLAKWQRKGNPGATWTGGCPILGGAHGAACSGIAEGGRVKRLRWQPGGCQGGGAGEGCTWRGKRRAASRYS